MYIKYITNRMTNFLFAETLGIISDTRVVTIALTSFECFSNYFNPEKKEVLSSRKILCTRITEICRF